MFNNLKSTINQDLKVEMTENQKFPGFFKTWQCLIFYHLNFINKNQQKNFFFLNIENLTLFNRMPDCGRLFLQMVAMKLPNSHVQMEIASTCI